MSQPFGRILTRFAVILTLIGTGCGDDPTDPGNGGGTQSGLLLTGHPDSSAVAATTLLLPTALPENEIVEHFLTNRVTAVVRLDATIGELNDALKRLDARIVSMNPNDNWLTLKVPAASVNDAESVAAALEATGAFGLVFPSFEAGPRELPPIDAVELNKITHLIKMKWPAAWNAAHAARTKITVIVPDRYHQREPHQQIDAQRFPNETRGGVTARLDPATNTNDGNHGFMTSGILGANWDNTPLTGTSRNPTALLDIVSVPVGGLSFDDAMDETIRHIPGMLNKFIMSASFGYPDSMPPTNLETHTFTRAMMAMHWRHRIAPFRGDLFIATAAGNRGQHDSANRLSEFDNWLNPDFMLDDLRDMVDQTLLSDPQRRTLNEQHAHYVQSEPRMDVQANNGVVVGSSDPDGRESGFSSIGAHVRALGVGVWAPCGIVDPHCISPLIGGTGSGTSFAAPQVAGLAAYLWSIDQSLTPDRIRDIVADAYSESRGFVDAYQAVLSLDTSANPDDGRVRLAILDVAGRNVSDPPDGKFDEVDLQKFVIEFTARSGKGPDYSRYDLNGDGLTGGSGKAAFDLSIDSPSPLIDPQPVKQFIEGASIDFSESALTDAEICLYYAYSSLWDPVGDTNERKQITCGNLLGPIAVANATTPLQPCQNPLAQITTHTTGDFSPSWSPDGSKIAFGSIRSGDADIWVISVTSGDATQITFEPQNTQPAWSPDGSLIAFMSNRTGDLNIWVKSATSGPAIQITTGPQPDTHPAWSPDGSKIAFASKRSGNWDIWVTPAAGGPATQITADPKQDWQPAWSPDGSKIAFASRRGEIWDIWVVPATGGAAIALNTALQNSDEPTWSPDGSHIAFMSTQNGNWDIWTVPATGGPITQITTSPKNDRQPAWSPDGSKIAFTSFRSGNSDVWTIILP